MLKTLQTSRDIYGGRGKKIIKIAAILLSGVVQSGFGPAKLRKYPTSVLCERLIKSISSCLSADGESKHNLIQEVFEDFTPSDTTRMFGDVVTANYATGHSTRTINVPWRILFSLIAQTPAYRDDYGRLILSRLIHLKDPESRQQIELLFEINQRFLNGRHDGVLLGVARVSSKKLQGFYLVLTQIVGGSAEGRVIFTQILPGTEEERFLFSIGMDPKEKKNQLSCYPRIFGKRVSIEVESKSIQRLDGLWNYHSSCRSFALRRE